MKRRDFLASTLATAGAAAGFLETTRVTAAEGISPKSKAGTKIVLIGHKPDHPAGVHLYLRECGLLAKCLRQTPGVEAIVSDGWPKDAAVLDGVSAIVYYSSPGADLLFAPDHAEQAEALLKRGVGLTALHWATGVKDDKNKKLADRYLSHLGGLFEFAWTNLLTTTSKLEPALAAHPVSRGWSAIDVEDEWYLNLKFLPEAKPISKVHVKVKNKDKEQVISWVYERPNANGGRSYGNTGGHFHKNFCMDSFRKAVVNGILWTAHHDIPAAGSPCAITADDVRL